MVTARHEGGSSGKLQPIPAIAGERYRVLEKIGEGGSTEVFRARDVRLDRIVALKVLREAYREQEVFVRSFGEEVRAMARMTHPNIVRVYDYDRAGGRSFVVMEYVRGHTLKEYLSGHASPAGEEVRRLAGQLLDGLSTMRRAHIIHTCVTPEDVRVDNAGILKILNVGIHKAVEAGGMGAAFMPFSWFQRLTPESTSDHDPDVAGLRMCGLLSAILLREPEHRPDHRAPGIYVAEHTSPVDSKGSPPSGQYAFDAPAGRRLAADRVAMGGSGSMVANSVASTGDSEADTVRFPAISNAQSGAAGLAGVGAGAM